MDQIEKLWIYLIDIESYIFMSKKREGGWL